VQRFLGLKDEMNGEEYVMYSHRSNVSLGKENFSEMRKD
jgi:hypothetical protein